MLFLEEFTCQSEIFMAETLRFELRRVTRPYRFSRPTPSTTWVRLQYLVDRPGLEPGTNRL